MRLYITGGTGLVGSNVIKVAQERYQAEIIASLYGPRPEVPVSYQLDPLDMRDPNAVRAAIQHYRPDAVIHCAALLDQQMLHQQRQLAWDIMVGGTRAFALACRETGARLVFVSSDWVFDGHESEVDEDSPPFPVNFYGIMKMASERELSAMDGLNYGVGRLAGVYGLNYAIPRLTRWAQGVGFGDLPGYYIRQFRHGEPVEVWAGGVNEAAHPTLATDGADMLLRLAQYRGNGIFHCFGSESISRGELARRVAAVFGGDRGLIREVPLPESEKAALVNIRIPYRAVIRTDKTEAALGQRGLNVDDGLRTFHAELAGVDVAKYGL
jgi:dTDP-4-dehydrorhamnose reductase